MFKLEEDRLFDSNTYDQDQSPSLGQCYRPPTYEELRTATEDMHLKLLPNNREEFFKLILKEQEVRLNKNVQDLYGQMNYSVQVEELIHKELFTFFGYDDCELNHKLYYALTRKYINDPELKPKIFFWRNNVMHGCKIQLQDTPPLIPLLTLQNQLTSLQDIMEDCDKQQKLCVVFAESMEEYLSFAQKNSDTCRCQFVYIKEAHFVERDKDGQYVDGWPIGCYEYEFAQHKSQEDRLKMALKLKQQYQIPENLAIYLDIFPQNSFDETFGIWPDNLVAFKQGKLVFRGIIELDGARQENHAIQLKQKLDKLKY